MYTSWIRWWEAVKIRPPHFFWEVFSFSLRTCLIRLVYGNCPAEASGMILWDFFNGSVAFQRCLFQKPISSLNSEQEKQRILLQDPAVNWTINFAVNKAQPQLSTIENCAPNYCTYWWRRRWDQIVAGFPIRFPLKPTFHLKTTFSKILEFSSSFPFPMRSLFFLEWHKQRLLCGLLKVVTIVCERLLMCTSVQVGFWVKFFWRMRRLFPTREADLFSSPGFTLMRILATFFSKNQIPRSSGTDSTFPINYPVAYISFNHSDDLPTGRKRYINGSVFIETRSC